MYSRAEKLNENKSRAVANAVGQTKSSAKQGVGIVDNRAAAAMQRKLKNHIIGKFNNRSTSRRLSPSTRRENAGAAQPAQLYTIGGADLSWLPRTTGTVKRYATADEKRQLDRYRGNYFRVVHKSSNRNAVWFSDTGKEYKADFASDRPYIFATTLNERDHSNFINAENVPTFRGEAQHPDMIIVKENERGAYGIGRNIINGMPMTVTTNRVKKKKFKRRR